MCSGPAAAAFEKALLTHYRDEFPEVRDEVENAKKLTDELDEKIPA